jgi:hypothetical protein
LTEKDDKTLLYPGKDKDIYAFVCNKKCEVLDFLNRLEQDDFSSFKKIMARIKFAAENQTHNKEIFNFEEDGIFAIKGNQVRIYGFLCENKVFLCCTALLKKSQKNKKSEKKKIEKCIEIRDLLKGKKDE